MTNPNIYAGIIGGVVALGVLIFSIFKNRSQSERENRILVGCPVKDKFEPGYGRSRVADWGENEDISSRSSREPRRSRAHEEVEKTPECTICTETLENGDELILLPKCNHTFHRNCILTRFREDRVNGILHTCPVCGVIA